MVISRILITVILGSFPSMFAVVNVVSGGARTGWLVKSGGNIASELVNQQVGTIVSFAGGDMSYIDMTTQITANSSDTTIYIDGNKRFHGNGQRTEKKIVIQGKDNRIEGDLSPSCDVDLQDNTVTVTYAGTRRFDQSINLNGGTIFLEEDISFNKDKRIQGPGNIFGNGRRISFGSSDFTQNSNLYFDNASGISINGNMTLESVWTFSGSKNRINGKGNLLTLGSGGKIIIERGSTLVLENIVLDGITTDNLYCKNQAGNMYLKDMGWLQDATYTFSTGSLSIKDHVKMIGNNIFVYQSPMTCTINRNSTLLLDTGYTFSYDVANGAMDRLSFVDETSILSFNLSNLYVTYPGLQLKKGTLLIAHEANFFVDHRTTSSSSGNGLIIGNNVSSDDVKIIILSGAIMDVRTGQLIYSNINSGSLNLLGAYSQLRMELDTKLTLSESMDFGRGGLFMNKNAGLARADGINITGSLHFFT